MITLALFLGLAAAPPGGAALPPELQEAAAPQEYARPEEPAEEGMGIVEYVYRYSEFEFGALYTVFDGDLDIESDWGFFVRGGVKLVEFASVQVSYRIYDFDNSDLPGGGEEGLRIHALLGGVGLSIPLGSEFTFKAHGSIGAIRWDSDLAHDETSPILSGEAGLVVRVHEALRLRAGAAADIVSTKFHDDSTETHLNLSGFLALEIGF